MKKNKETSANRIIHNGIVIREVRPGYFMIDVQRDGKRQRQCFTDLQEAKTAVDQLAIAIRNEGVSVLDLTPDQRSDAVKALRLAAGTVTLADAVKYWIDRNGISTGVTVAQIADRWLAALRAQGCRETTLAEREQKTGRLRKDIGDAAASSITKQAVNDWMDGYRLAGQTRDGYRRCFRAMFQYALEENLVADNPVAGIKKIRMDEKLPEFFTVKQVHAIMAAAEKRASVMVPTLAVQFFAGLRPGEALGLSWMAVDFTEKIIRITPETSKVRRTRIIEMNDALLAWLKPYRKMTGPVGITTKAQWAYWMQHKPLDKKAGVIGVAGVDWIQDGPRHTFASMHYATHGDAAKLASIMGHTGGHDVLFRHYRGLVKKTEADRYWKIRPAKKARDSNVIELNAGAAA